MYIIVRFQNNNKALMQELSMRLHMKGIGSTGDNIVFFSILAIILLIAISMPMIFITKSVIYRYQCRVLPTEEAKKLEGPADCPGNNFGICVILIGALGFIIMAPLIGIYLLAENVIDHFYFPYKERKQRKNQEDNASIIEKKDQDLSNRDNRITEGGGGASRTNDEQPKAKEKDMHKDDVDLHPSKSDHRTKNTSSASVDSSLLQVEKFLLLQEVFRILIRMILPQRVDNNSFG